jgi:starvation-inducible DNA-binding protein
MNHIGLDTEQSKNLANKLNNLLATYQVFYINTRGLHWNIKGEKFFELHVKFEELYNDSFLKIDEIAERIVTLGLTPLHSYTAYLETSSIKEVTHVSEARESVQTVLDAFRELLKLEREILSLSADAEDEGTNALMSDYIREHEKSVWMYSSFLN